MRMKYPMVLVEWRDAHNNPNWRKLEKVLQRGEEDLIVVRSVGYLLQKTPRILKLGHGISEDDMVESTLTLPRDWCQKIKRIK